MKHFNLRGILAAVGLTAILTAGASAATLGTATVDADALRIRASADAGSVVLSMAYKGDKVEVLKDAGNGWYQVSLNGVTGYMSGEYLKANWKTTTATAATTRQATPTVTTVAASTPASGNVKVNLSAGEVLNLRSAPSSQGSKLASIPGGTVLALEESSNGWYKVTYNGTTGYVSSEYMVSTTEAVGTVAAAATTASTSASGNVKVNLGAGDVLNLRSGPSSQNSKVASIPGGTVLALEGTSGSWYKVTYNGMTGYVSSEYVVSTTEAVGTVAPVAASNSYGDTIVAIAKQYIGCPYVYGASGPYSFDCSGFTSYVYRKVGISIPHGATSQYRSGTPISRENLQVGDLVFISDPAYTMGYPVSHVGIYIGNGQFIHASSNRGEGVTISNIFSGHYGNYYAGARRYM